MPPIHFWPRLVAGVVDYLMATVLAMAMIWPFLGVHDQLRLDVAGLMSIDCDTKGRIPAILRDQIGAQPYSYHDVCQTSLLGRSNGKTATLVYGGLFRDGHPTPSQSIFVAVSDDFTPVTPLKPQTVITLLVLIFGGGLLIRRNGQTLGKRLVGLKVTGASPVPGFAREVIKLLPCLLLALASLAWTFVSPPIHTNLWGLPWSTLASVAVALGLPLGWFYVLPILRWRGALHHDRWLGLTVVQV